MFTVIVIIALVICVILALAVLIQNPKGGGLSGTFGGAANQLFGYKRTTDDVERITWGLVAAIFVLCLASAAFTPTQTDQIENRYVPESQVPASASPMQDQTQPVDNAEQSQEQPVSDEPLPTGQ